MIRSLRSQQNVWCWLQKRTRSLRAMRSQYSVRKIVRYVMEHMTTLIMEDELVVGTPTNKYKGANLFPEYTSSKWLTEDIDDFPVRKTDPYYISPEDREVILETLKEWEGKSDGGHRR